MTINIVNVVEPPPPRPAAPQVDSLPGLESGLAVAWREPQANGGPPLTGYDLRYREGESGDWRESAGLGAATETTLTGLQPVTTYQVQVRARNGDGPGEWSPAGTGAPRGEIAQAWLARFGRAASDNTIQAIENRWRGERIANQASHLTLGGYQVNAFFDRDGNGQGGFGQGGAAFGEQDLTGSNGERFGLTGAGANLLSASPGSTLASGNDLMNAGGPANAPAGSPFSAVRNGPPATSASLKGGPAVVSQSRELPELRDVLMGSSFFYSSADSGSQSSSADGDSQSGAPSQWAFWGDVAGSRFDGQDGETSLNGNLTTATAGADFHRGRWFGGVALSWSEGDGDYRYGTGETGEMRSELTSVNPYLRYEHSQNTSFWGVFGIGSGEWSLTPEGAVAGLSHDLTTTTAAFGGRGVVSRTPGGFELAVRSDIRATDTRADALSGMADDGGRTSRARLLLEGSRAWALDSGAMLGITLEAGLRADGGDAETGGGAEVGGALSYATGRFALQASARTLAAHENEQYRESGAGISLLYRPRADGSGFSLQFGSAWGATQSGIQQLWARQDARGLARGGRSMGMAQRYETELGFGIAGRGKAVLWRPWFGAQSTHGGAPAMRMGLQFTSGATFETGLEFGLRPGLHGAKSENAVILRGALRW